MKRKVVSLMMCAALTIAPASSVWAEDVLSSGEELEILQSETELIDGQEQSSRNSWKKKHWVQRENWAVLNGRL